MLTKKRNISKITNFHNTIDRKAIEIKRIKLDHYRENNNNDNIRKNNHNDNIRENNNNNNNNKSKN